MKKAILFTAFDRPGYLRQVLDAWVHVRGLDEWHILALVEPSQHQESIKSFFEKLDHPNIEVCVNPQVYGVLHNPWVGFERLFCAQNYDFVVRAEDDLLVSDDILEYFSWAANEYAPKEQVASVGAFTHADGPSDTVSSSTGFSPWVWGTWRDRWTSYIGPTWDHDYSTFNVVPGNQAGWDWNLNTRILPQLGKTNIFPSSSRVQNIGVHGTHADPTNFVQTQSFSLSRPKVSFKEV